METLSINYLIKDSPAPVAILDKELRFIMHSDIWAKEFGGDNTEIIGKSYYNILTNTPDEIKNLHAECLKGISNSNKGKKFTHTDGTVQWIKWKMNAWKDENKQIGGIIIVQEDITEEKRREKLLIKAKSVARIGGWEVDLVTNTVYWTTVTKEIHEVPKDYVPNLEEGINFYKKGEHREKITKLVSDAMNKGTPWDTELIIVTAKGKEKWVHAKGEVEIVNGKCTRIFGTFQDIDEKKRKDIEYQEISDRLAIATHAAKIGIWDYNIVENNLVWDKNMYTLYGISSKDFSGVVEAWETAVHPEDKAYSQKELEMAIAGVKEFNTEFRIKWPNDEIRYIRALATVKRDEDGNPLRMIGANWDITNEKKAEKNLRNLLNISSEQNNSLMNFAHIVSHNLRSHSSNLSMLSGFLASETDEVERDNLLIMLKNASDSLSETVMHLNEVVQVKSGAIGAMKDVDLADIVNNVEKNLSVSLKEKNARFAVDISKNLKLKGIPAYFDSIFLNLLSNSLKYSSPDRSPNIKLTARKTEDKVQIIFEDNGLGIDLDRHKDKLFGMYKTFHRNKDAKGIGLFITKNQVEAMNGQIKVESKVDKGTTFMLTFNRD